MKQAPSQPISIPPDIAAKCTGPGQFERFDRLFHSVIAVPKAEAVKAEEKWKRDRAKKRAGKKPVR